MQLGFVNRRAQERYGTFVSTLDMIADVLRGVDTLIDGYDEHAMNGSWTIATRDELAAHRTAAFEQLDRLRTLGKKHEAELISRNWRL